MGVLDHMLDSNTRAGRRCVHQLLAYVCLLKEDHIQGLRRCLTGRRLVLFHVKQDSKNTRRPAANH